MAITGSGVVRTASAKVFNQQGTAGVDLGLGSKNGAKPNVVGACLGGGVA